MWGLLPVSVGCGVKGAVALRPGLLPVSDVRLGRENGAVDAVLPPGALAGAFGWA